MSPLNIAILVAVAGAALLWFGLRGRRVGDHPFCRRCGFDLFGKPEDSSNCPECGASLARPTAQVIGVRHRRPWMAALGALLLLPTLFIVAVIVFGRWTGVDWQKHKPVWYLAREACGSDVPARDAALVELLTRYNAKTLSKQQVATLVAQGLMMQARLDVPWSTRWGDLIEAMQATGNVPAPQWKRYLEQAVATMYTLRFRERLTPDLSPMSYRLDRGDARAGSASSVWQFTRVTGLVVDGNEVTRSDAVGGSGFSGASLSTAGGAAWANRTFVAPSEFLRELSYGPHEGYVRVQVSVLPNPPPQFQIQRGAVRLPSSSSPLQTWIDTQKLAQVELKLPLKFELLPPGEPVMQAINDDSLRDAVAASLKVTNAKVVGTRHMQVRVSCVRPPIDLSFRVFVRDGTWEVPMGMVAFRRDDPSNMPRMLIGTVSLTDAPRSRKVNVIFRPDPEPGVRTPDMTRYWNGEVVLNDVPVENPFASVRPFPTTQSQPLGQPRLWDGMQWEQERDATNRAQRF